ncbi:GspE/PulE family protein [Staphylospora marina]|uniref:GspE/PulE family protein n=1 Tax=Staphylospora marina TaxID=2490858 RepID=UPI001F14BA37|nr:GspE/PulE family protein [Staphylospora marina]
MVACVEQLIGQAVEWGASDIHIEPLPDRVRIRKRVDGFLVEVRSFPPEWASPLVSRIKVMSGMDIGERRMPQDGSLTLDKDGERFDVRISTVPVLYGEKMVLRLMKSHARPVSLDGLGMEMATLETVKRLLKRSNGLLLVTGPTGCGKTTTLYAMAEELNRPETNIVTLEDPVERRLEGINQIRIHPRAGLTFARGLRAVLRQDPDVIMIGEIRDAETAAIAASAALTGHLVLSSLHTADAASAVTRLVDMGVEPYRVAAALAGVIAQRLVRLVCWNCGGSGCEGCMKTGYCGRTGVFEVMVSDERLERMIVRGDPVHEIRRHLRKQGVVSLGEAVKRKMDQGLTTREEWMRVIGDVVEETVEG